MAETFLLDQIYAAQDFTSQLEWYLRRTNPYDITEAFNDRHSTGAVHRYDLGRTARILYGRVVDALAYCHWYKVQPEGLMTPIPCCMLSNTALSPVGVRHINPLQPGARVYLLHHPTAPYGVILGVEPPALTDPRRVLSDFVTQSSSCGVQVDGCHQFPFTLPMGGSVFDWSAGRPSDGTAAGGEHGWMAESGVGLFLDSAMAFIRGDENCGVWCFYRDQLTRVAGHNLQVRSAGLEWEALDDQGEFNFVQGVTPYPHEQLGAYAFGNTVHRELTAEESQVLHPYYARLEPLSDDQQPFHRIQDHQGYLPNGRKRLVTAPPVSAPSGGVYRQSGQYVLPGLFEENVTLDGSYSLRSAKRVMFAKRSTIPIPKQVRRPEDLAGDRPATYKAAGLQGSGPSHVVTDRLASDEDREDFNRILGHLDEQTYHFNRAAALGYFYHTLDYFLPEESDVQEAAGLTAQEVPDFAALKTASFLDPAEADLVQVDSRYGQVALWPNLSYLALIEDGGVVLGSGGGAEIRLVGGDIEITCPGDLKLLPGRRTVNLSGMDCVIRAHNCIDLSTTLSDVRIRSGQSAYICAQGGLLLESKADDSNFTGFSGVVGTDVTATGIILKAARSAVVAWADEVYLRAGVPDDDGNATVGKGILIDSGKGLGVVVVTADTCERFLTSGALDYFGADGDITAANSFGASGNVLGACLGVVGDIVTTEGVVADQWFVSANGHFASGQSDTYRNLVATYTSDGAATVVTGVQTAENTAKEDGVSSFLDVFTTWLYASDGEGLDANIKEAKFSYRSVSQYKTSDYALFEARWQQLARLSSQTLSAWTEQGMTAGGQTTYPFPGKERWKTDEAFYTQDLRLFDVSAGYAKDRADDAYTDPSYASLVGTVPDGNYPIIDPAN